MKKDKNEQNEQNDKNFNASFQNEIVLHVKIVLIFCPF